MSVKAFSKITRGLKVAQAYMEGEREGYKVTAPPTVDAKEPPEKPGAPRLDSETWDFMDRPTEPTSLRDMGHPACLSAERLR